MCENVIGRYVVKDGQKKYQCSVCFQFKRDTQYLLKKGIRDSLYHWICDECNNSLFERVISECNCNPNIVFSSVKESSYKCKYKNDCKGVAEYRFVKSLERYMWICPDCDIKEDKKNVK